MLVVKNVSKHLYGEPLFERVSFVLHKKDRVGLIGQNGSGKSTLLKIISRELEADSGSVNLDNERLGYLSQEINFSPSETVASYLRDTRSDAALKKVGLARIPTRTLAHQLSGGQKTRLALAKVLLQNPTLLLLDEPTNHLDIEGLKWLETFIHEFPGAILIVTHDRRLLDNCADRILELDAVNHTFHEYQGNYSNYLLLRKNRMAQWENAYERQQKEKRRMEKWLVWMKQQASAHPDPSKGKKIRAMEKRIQREIYDQAIAKPKEKRAIRELTLAGDSAIGKLIVRVSGLSKSFGAKTVLQDVSFEIRGKEYVLLRGANGSGKSTLLKILIGELPYESGDVLIGEGVQIGYFAQEHETLNPENTVMEEFLSTERKKPGAKDPRSILGAFLFKEEAVFKKIASLSLGERARLIFAKLTSQENKLLILDEPTNHLDIDSREIIENALLDYEGAILVVSHDRYFLDKIGIDKTINL